MTVKPSGFEPPFPLAALFEPDAGNPHIAQAIELRKIFARDAIERDQLGGRPQEQIKLLKESGSTCPGWPRRDRNPAGYQ